MEEEKRQKLNFDRIQCITHSKSTFLTENIQLYSIFEMLCITYNNLINLDIEFSYSQNNSYSNIIVNNLPTIIYGNSIIRKSNIPNFFKLLTGIDQDIEKKDIQTKMYFEMMEKLIFSDMQMLLNYYSYLYDYDKSSIFWNAFRFIYSPVQCFISNYNDRKISRTISKILNVFTRKECLEQIKQINIKIENFLASFGEDYYTKLNERNINSLDLAIYSAIKTQISVLKNKFKQENNQFQLDKHDFRILKTFLTSFDDMILNKKQIKNVLWSFASAEYEKYCPKPNFVDSSFNKYSQLNNLSEEENNVQIKRKLIISSCFIGFLMFSRLFG